MLLAGLCLPLVPNWGPGFWPSAPGPASPTTAGEPTPEVAVTASGAVIPEAVVQRVPPLTYPSGYTGSPDESDTAAVQTIASAAPIQDAAVTPVEATVVTTAVPKSPDLQAASSYQWSFPVVLVIAYGIGVAVMLCRLLLGLIYLTRLRHAAGEGAAAVVELFDSCCRELDVRRATLRVHPRVVSPIVCGLLRPCVIVPPDFGELSRPTQHACLTHELTHILRRDSCAMLLTETVRALFFFHPAGALAVRAAESGTRVHLRRSGTTGRNGSAAIRGRSAELWSARGAGGILGRYVGLHAVRPSLNGQAARDPAVGHRRVRPLIFAPARIPDNTMLGIDLRRTGRAAG